METKQPHTNGSGNLADVLDAPPKPAELRSIQLDAARDFHLTREALVHRADSLTSVAKKNSAEGYPRQAREIENDADRIKRDIVPKFTVQADLPFVTDKELHEEIRGAVQLMVADAYENLGPKSKVKVTEQGLKYRREQLVKRLTERILAFSTETGRVAFEAGYAQSRTTPEFYAMKAVDSLRDRTG